MATTKLTITLKSGKKHSFNPGNLKQLKDAINYMNDEKEIVKLVKQYGDDSLKTAWKVNAKGKQQAKEMRQYIGQLKSKEGQRETQKQIKLMTSQPDFMPKLGDPLSSIK